MLIIQTSHAIKTMWMYNSYPNMSQTFVSMMGLCQYSMSKAIKKWYAQDFTKLVWVKKK